MTNTFGGGGGNNNSDFGTATISKKDHCCIGELQITYAAVITGTFPTHMTYEATVQMDTISDCDKSSPCKDCREWIDSKNKKNLFDALPPEGKGTAQSPVVDTVSYWKFLGCCESGCNGGRVSQLETITGTILRTFNLKNLHFHLRAEILSIYSPLGTWGGIRAEHPPCCD